MFTLRDYVATLLELVTSDKDASRRQSLIDDWIRLLKSHNRILEVEKAMEMIETEFEKRKEGVLGKVSSEESKEKLEKFFLSQGIKSKIEVDPAVLGGFRVVWKNKLYDNTLETKIKGLEKKITR